MQISLRAKLAERAALISLLCFFILTGAITAPAQPATKPQTSPGPADAKPRVTETLVDGNIADDPALNNMLAAYSPRVRELETVIGKLQGELKKGGTGAGSLGNFVADGMRQQAALKTVKPVTVALVNGSGLRRNNVAEGELRIRDIFELLPFENALVTIDLNGQQLTRLLDGVVSSGLAQSGARIIYKTTAEKKNETESIKLLGKNGEVDIDPAATYTVVTIDYLYNVGGDRYAVLREGTMKPLGLTLRDALIAYVKAETAAGRDIKSNLDGRFSLDRANSVNPDGRPE